MKRVVRQMCFETNSSSQHSIVVTKNDAYINPEKIVWDSEGNCDPVDCVYIGKDGEWSLRDIEDGYGRWPFRILTSFEDKFKYAMCEYMGYLYEDDPEWQKWYDEFEAIAYKFVPGFVKFRMRTKDIDIYKDENGNDILQKDLRYDYYNEEKDRSEYYYLDSEGNKKPAIFDEENYLEMPNIGCIDHQSMGLLKNFLKDSGISLREFLTNKRYVVVIDSDEICDWPRYKNSGIINMDFIISEYNTSGEDIEYQQWLKEREENEESNS